MEKYIPLGKSIKTHLYWAMRNCGENADTLKNLIDNIPSHYQVFHAFWDFIHTQITHLTSSSSCHMSRYTYPVQLLSKTLRETYIYRYAKQFCGASILHVTMTIISLFHISAKTHTVESFYHMILTYVLKPIHFSTKTFQMKMNLAVLDWVRYSLHSVLRTCMLQCSS